MCLSAIDHNSMLLANSQAAMYLQALVPCLSMVARFHSSNEQRNHGKLSDHGDWMGEVCLHTGNLQEEGTGSSGFALSEYLKIILTFIILVRGSVPFPGDLPSKAAM